MRRFNVRLVASVPCSFIALLACGRSDKAPVADSTVRPAPGAHALVAGGQPSARAYPGALTKPLDDYSGDELFALTRSLTYVGSHERDRGCKDSSDCQGTGPRTKTLVQVSAVETQDSLSAGDVPAFGVVYTRAINRGDAVEARYGMRPGKDLRYYMIVQRDSAGALRWRLEELATAPPRRHVQIGSGPFAGCGHAWTPGARADFKTCQDPERADTVVTLALSMQHDDAPMWTGCSTGCCIY